MKSFSEYINEQPVIQPTPVAPTSPNQAQSSEGQPTEAAVCETLLMVYEMMGCRTEEPQRSCPTWREMLIKRGCMSAPTLEPEDKPHPLDDPGFDISPFAPSRVPKI